MDRKQAFMDRKQALLGAALTAATFGMPARSRGDDSVGVAGPPLPVQGAIALRIGQAMDLRVQSNPVQYKGQTFSLLSIGRGTFMRDAASHLTAILKAGVLQWARVDYWVSVAVFDAAGNLLGTASHKEEVQRIELGRTPIIFRDIALDFGISKGFANAAFVVIAISERDVPTPPDSGNREKRE